MTRGTRRLHRAVAVLYAVALTYLLLSPEPLFFLGGTGESVDKAVESTVADWLQHSASYTLFGLLVFSAADRVRRRPVLVGVILLHGVFCEVAHYWIPRREFNLFDLLANVIGGLAGAAIAVAWREWRNWHEIQEFPGGFRF